jgi:AcrR family transcriptional regulator
MTLGSIPHEGLRERKKQLTRETIARVALDLFYAHGFHETTIAQVAAAANVSPRTVSSYFPAKEDLVFPESGAAFAGLGARLAERRPGETAADAIRDWIATQLPEWRQHHEVMRKQRALVEADASLRAYQQAFMLRGEQLIADAIAGDLDASPEDLEPRMAAAATFAIFGVLGDDAKDEEAAPEASDAARCAPFDTDAAMAIVDKALRFVDAGIRALRGGGDPPASDRPATPAP